MAFNNDERVQADVVARDWVRRTTVALQEPLRDFVVGRFRATTLATLTEPELRQFAFDVHPRAYTAGGLKAVAMATPSLIPIIISIPGKEFLPWARDPAAAFAQGLITFALVAPDTMGTVAVLGMSGGPAHTGMLSRAIARDAAELRRDLNTGRWLGHTLRSLQSGKLDSLPVLNALTAQLNATQFGDQAVAAAARQVVHAADERKHRVARYYRQQIEINPRVRPSIDQYAPNWSKW